MLRSLPLLLVCEEKKYIKEFANCHSYENYLKRKKILDINVLHIERNVFVNVFDTIMDFKGKTRDTDKGRLDLAHW